MKFSGWLNRGDVTRIGPQDESAGSIEGGEIALIKAPGETVTDAFHIDRYADQLRFHHSGATKLTVDKDGNFWVAGDIYNAYGGGYALKLIGNQINSVGTAVKDLILNYNVAGDVYVGFTGVVTNLRVDPGNLGAKILIGGDTNLYRAAADVLRTDDVLEVGGAGGWTRIQFTAFPVDAQIVKLNPSGYNSWFWLENFADAGYYATIGLFRGSVAGTPRFFILKGDGTATPGIVFQPRSGAMIIDGDTNLYRLQANWLKTDDNFDFAGQIFMEPLASPPRLRFGPDVVLYRSGPDSLRIDDNLDVGGVIWANRASDGVNAGMININNPTSGRYWHIPIRANESDSLNFYFWDGASWYTAIKFLSPLYSTFPGILFGTDVNLYRAAADVLKTDDNLYIGVDENIRLIPGAEPNLYFRNTVVSPTPERVFYNWTNRLALTLLTSGDLFTIESAVGNPVVTFDRAGNLSISGYGNLGSLQIGGTQVISSGRVLQNLSADASLITSGRFSLSRMPYGASGYVLTGQGTGVDPVYIDPATIPSLKRAMIMWGLVM